MSFVEDNEKRALASPQVSVESAETATVDRRRVLRKLDWHLLPFVSLLYLLSFLDRTNIGNAKVAGLTTDLKLTGLQYNLCSAIFFLLMEPYSVLDSLLLFRNTIVRNTFSHLSAAFNGDVRRNMAMKFLKPSRWIPLIMFCWGIVMVCMAFVKDFSGLLAARIFLGLAESGLFPGVTFYLCLWYPRGAQAQRMSLFLSAATVAGAFGGILAFGIEKMDGVGGLHGWSWIAWRLTDNQFILEGLVTIIVSAVSYFFMYDYPETAGFLTSVEKQWLVETLREDTANSSKGFKWKFLLQALRDPHSYLMVAAWIYSDHWRTRGPFVLAGTLTALVGYVVLYATKASVAGYIGTVIASCGLFPAVACVLAWTGGNFSGDVKRGVVIAMVIGIGNLGGIASSFIYLPQDSPRYHPGHATDIACLCVSSILIVVAMLEFSRLNAKRNEQCSKEGIHADRAEEFHELGDQSPLFRPGRIMSKRGHVTFKACVYTARGDLSAPSIIVGNEASTLIFEDATASERNTRFLTTRLLTWPSDPFITVHDSKVCKKSQGTLSYSTTATKTALHEDTGSAVELQLKATFGSRWVMVSMSPGFGVTSMQTYLWWRHYPRDPLQIRLVVWSLLIHMIYYYLVINYNSPEALTKSVWSFDVSALETGHDHFDIPLILLSGVRLAFGCVVTARMFQIQVLDKLPDAMAPYVGTGMGSGSIADCIITASLVYYLRDHKTGFNSRLNFRKAHRGRGVTDEESSIPLSSMRAGEGDRSFSKRDSSAVAPVVHVMTTTITDAPDADGDKKPTPLDYHFTHAIVDDVSDMGTYKRDQDRV
ncbi:predicted protein [Postia placenta Mad-698-R]|nr:predicted protein [Postia placenta Mad-698-R]